MREDFQLTLQVRTVILAVVSVHFTNLCNHLQTSTVITDNTQYQLALRDSYAKVCE